MQLSLGFRGVVVVCVLVFIFIQYIRIMTFNSDIVLECASCQGLIVETDCASDRKNFCLHGKSMRVVIRYSCKLCRYRSKWLVYTKGNCQLCERMKNHCYSKGGNIFYVDSKYCRGHEAVEYGCDAKCLDCYTEECSCYGFKHCCCDLNQEHDSDDDELDDSYSVVPRYHPKP